jgi:hypothetical protein
VGDSIGWRRPGQGVLSVGYGNPSAVKQHGVEQMIARGEVTVERGHAKPGFRGNVVKGYVEAALGEQ